MNGEFKVKFWGVRGSHPAPGAGTVKYGGNTSCVEVNAGGRTIILDAGTGIISLGRELAKRAALEKRDLEVLLLFSHLHHDHTQGFPFFVPAYIPTAKLHIFGPGGTRETVKHVLDHNQSAETFPVRLRDMSANKEIQTLRELQVIVWDESGVYLAESGQSQSEEAVVIRIYRSYAHPGGVYVYRITYRSRSVVYATDTEGYIGTDRKLASFAKNADLLIHDAQYRDDHYNGQLAGFPSAQGYGHSTATMAAELAASCGTSSLILFHHEPAYADEWVAEQEQTAQKIFSNSRAAYEGMEVDMGVKSTQTFDSRREVQYVEND